MDHATFAERLELSQEYYKWCERNDVRPCAESFAAFLSIKNIINPDALRAFLIACKARDRRNDE